MHKGIYIIGLLLLLLASCTGDKEVRALLDRAEVLMDSCPDSAYAIMQTVSSPNLKGSGERVRSLYGLLRTTADAMQGNGVTADSLIRPAYEYYKVQGETDENIRRLGRSAFYLARFEASRDSTKRAEDLYREAIHCSEQVEDWRTCYLAHNYFATTMKWSNITSAIQLRKKALNIYNRCKDKPANYISILNSLSNDYLVADFADSAFNCAEEAYQLSCDLQLEIQQYESLRRLSDCYYYTQNYPKALELAKQGMHGLTEQTRDASLFSLADCYLACDSIEQAQNTLLSIYSSDKKTRQVVFEELLQLAHVQKDYEAAMRYADSLEVATVDMFTNIQQTKDEYYQENLKKELYNMQLAQHKRQQAFMLWGAIILIIVISVFVVVIYHKSLKIARQKRVNAIMFRKDDNREYSLKVNRLEQDLKEKNERVSSLENDFETYKEESNKITEQQHLRFETLKSELDVHLKDGSTLLRLITDEGISVNMTDSLWKQLELYLNHYKNNFISLLRSHFHKMDELDIQICMLSLIGLSNSRMAELMNRDSSTIKRRKRHIKNHIFGLSDIDADFQDIILSLYHRNIFYQK